MAPTGVDPREEIARLRRLLARVVEDFYDDGPGYCCLRGQTFDDILAEVPEARRGSQRGSGDA